VNRNDKSEEEEEKEKEGRGKGVSQGSLDGKDPSIKYQPPLSTFLSFSEI
jgi:hypothetical protein